MDLLNGSIRKQYFKYLRAVTGSSLMLSFYSIVDTVCIGRYEGPDGPAAVSCMYPVWSILYAYGILFGIGGAVYMSQYRGAGRKEEGDRYFTAALFASIAVGVIVMAVCAVFMRPIFALCGAGGNILELTCVYYSYNAWMAALYGIGRTLSIFINNDGSPVHATLATVSGGIFNIFGDIYLVFVRDMGIRGAGLATAMGQVIVTLLLVSYFFRKKCTLKLNLDSVSGMIRRLGNIISMGISSFVIDMAQGVLIMIFNNQIMACLGTAALSVYGVASQLYSMMQSVGYAVGESAQPLMAANFGAGNKDRIRETMKYAGISAFVFGTAAFLLASAFPVTIIEFYMEATPEVLSITPVVFRIFFTACIVQVFNILTTYYFQAVGRPSVSMGISLIRGVVLSGILLMVLPVLFGGNAIWFTMPVTEALVFAAVMLLMRRGFSGAVIKKNKAW